MAEASVAGGYRSEDEKRIYRKRVGMVIAGVFFGQIVAALLITIPVAKGVVGILTAGGDAASARYRDGQIYFVEHEGGEKAAWYLRRMKPDGAVEPEKTLLKGEYGSLVSEGDKLWYVTADLVELFEGNSIVASEFPGAGMGARAPFLADGSLHVVAHDPGGPLVFMAWLEGAWKELARTSTPANPRTVHQALYSGGLVHLFSFSLDGPLSHAALDPAKSSGVALDWREVAPQCKPGIAYEDDGIAAACMRREGRQPKVDVFGLKDGKWSLQKTRSSPIWGDWFNGLGTLPPQGQHGRLFALVRKGEALGLYREEGESLVRVFARAPQYGETLKLLSLMFGPYLLLALFPLLLAGLLDREIAASREDAGVAYGSLLRRGGAQLVDMVLLGLPLIAVLAVLIRALAHDEEKLFVVVSALVGVELVWLLLGLIAFSWSEGAYGVSPGKKLLGLEVVGVDGERCGFARAVLRNALKLADGFMGWLPGLLAAGLSDKRQRLGDMAAKTVVVRAKPD